MTDERYLEVFRQLRVSQDKYTYFLLAASGAAVALAINQTHGANISWSQFPLAGAVLCWGFSFFFGCRQIAYVNSTLYANGELLRIEAGQHPEVGRNPAMIGAASEGIREAMENNSNSANRFAYLQFRFLIAGAILYIGWHIIEMTL